MSGSVASSGSMAMLLAAALVFASNVHAQETASPQGAESAPPSKESRNFSKEQLEQIAAPIALHPDPLLSQMLMASTYPLEVVEAHRFMSANSTLKGKELDEKLKQEDWEAAVKSLCTVPEVLKQMNDNLDWTQDLGDAFLGQRAELMDAVQRLRNAAYDSGNLKTTEQQVVTQQPDKIIVIQSPSPEVVYVPSYSPTVVYGPSYVYPAPYYPAMYVPPPYGYGLVAFGTGVAVGAALYGGCSWGWGNSEVDIDINENHTFNRNTNANFDRESFQAERGERQTERGERQDARGERRGAEGRGAEGRGAGEGKAKWSHDPSHRKGVNYRDQNTASQFGAREGQSRVARGEARGYSGSQGRAGSARGRDVATPGTRDAGRSGSLGGGERRSSSRGGGESAFGGSRNPGLDRSASARGDSSRGGGGSRMSSGSSRGSSRGTSRGGMSRGGGGRGGGGGRRR